MTNKQKYRSHCETEKTIPIFSQAWWLDATSGEEWDVCLVENDNRILASMPYVTKKHYGFVELSQPPLTQKLGPWLKPSIAKNSKALRQQKKLMNGLISQLPGYHYFNQNWHHSYRNWLPFYWNDFSQTTRVTYRIPNLEDPEKIWKGFQSNIRGDIKKSLKLDIRLKQDPTIDEFIELNSKVFARQDKPIPYSEELVRKIDTACIKNKCSKIFLAVDTEGQNHAAVYLIWDQDSAYYLMGGGDPDLRTSGATSFCIWEAIKFSAQVTESFDFEGSMIEPVERFFRAFGADQVFYNQVSKSNSRVIDLLMLVRSWRN